MQLGRSWRVLSAVPQPHTRAGNTQEAARILAPGCWPLSGRLSADLFHKNFQGLGYGSLVLLRLGDFELDEERFELRLRGKPVAVQPRVLETLQFLARRPEQLVTKEPLIAGPWRGLNVSDSAHGLGHLEHLLRRVGSLQEPGSVPVFRT